MSFWKNKKVLVTGGKGFLGSHICDRLDAQGASCFVPRSTQYDLTEQEEVRRMFSDIRTEFVIHCAVLGGGIGFMSRNPASTFYSNLMMNTLVMEEARRSHVEKFVGIGTVCSYPKFTPVPFQEKDLWVGYPEETNAPYGLSKKMMLVQSEAYRRQYNFNSIHLLLVNLYGPRDNFHLENSHVIPALIKKCDTAIKNGDTKIEVWGSGAASREFVYVEDAARAVLLAAEKYDSPAPVNIGSGYEIGIKDLVGMIAEITGYPGEFQWNTSLPDGQPRRLLDITKAYEEFGFRAQVSLREGIQKTVEWYRKTDGR